MSTVYISFDTYYSNTIAKNKTRKMFNSDI